MKVLVVEDDRKIKAEAIDDCLASLGHENDWATNQQEANELLAANSYGLVLLDLQIPSRPGGKDLPEFGKNLLRQIRARMGRDVPVILMTAYHQQCVDLITELHEIGIDGSISKPFPTTGRTLAVVIADVVERHRRFRLAAKANEPEQPLAAFAGGVLAFHSRHIELCGESVASKGQKGYAWRILHLLRDKNERGRYVHIDSAKLAAKIHPNLSQNTLIQAIKALRDRITSVLEDKLRYRCGPDDVIANGGRGYHLREWIIVEEYDDAGTLSTAPGGNGTVKPAAAPEASPEPQLSDRQHWVLNQLAAGGQITRQTVEQQFGVSDRTAKPELGQLCDLGMIEFDRSKQPGRYRLK